MDRTLARLARDTRGDWRLVCPDCKERQPDLLVAAVGRKTAGQLAGALGTTPEAAGAWLLEGLRAHSVLLRFQEARRVYWLPGVGRFSLLLERGPARPPLLGGPLGKLAAHPEIRSQPQARTRGLPRLRGPSAASVDRQTAS
jgi:hypothetical protein